MLLRGPALPASPVGGGPRAARGGLRAGGSRRRGRIPTRCGASSGPGPISSGRPTCSRSCSSGRTAGVYLVAFLDDHSRFLVGYGLHASQSTALVLEVLRAAIAGYGTPEEILTDNGTPVRHLAGQERLQQGAGEARHPADRGPRRGGRRRWARSSASGARCGGSASRRRCSSTWTTPGGGSACSSTTTTSSGRIRGSTAWCRPTASSARRRRCWQTLQARVAANALELARQRRAQAAVLPDRPGGGSAVQRARRRRARDPDARRASRGRRSTWCRRARRRRRGCGRVRSRPSRARVCRSRSVPMARLRASWATKSRRCRATSALDEGLRQLDRLNEADSSAEIRQGGDA